MGFLRKKYIDQDVYSKAKERLAYLYNQFDRVVVSFSGGKDSTALLLCAIDVAEEIGKLPVKAHFYDEEAIHPPTIEYVERVRNDPRVDLDWYCLPVKHRNACSNEQPYWYCWNPDERDLWVRELPECAITTHPRFKMGMTMQEFGIAHYQRTNTCVAQGIRTEESIRRYRMVARKKEENYISKPAPGAWFAYPIYDWSSSDVWKVVEVKGADYNRTYDVFNRTHMYEHFLQQRVCPPFGEEPVRGLHLYKECFPGLWFKMINRVKGAATAARYGRTELYGEGFKPEHTSWRAHVDNILETYEPKARAKVIKQLNYAIDLHKRRTNDPVPNELAHPVSGLSWRFLSRIVTRGDLKGRMLNRVENEAIARRHSMGITLEEAKLLYGKK